MRTRLIIVLLCAAISFGFRSNDVTSKAVDGQGAKVTVNVNPPATPANGDLWFDPVSVQLYIWYDDGSSKQWVPTINQPTGGGGGAQVVVSSSAPPTPTQGTLWFDTTSVQMFIFYNDGTSSQWVPVVHR